MPVELDMRVLENIERQLDGKIDSVLSKMAHDMDTEIKRSMANETKSGRNYDGHTASAEGEAPAVDTGNLINTIIAKRERRGVWTVLAGGGVAADYAIALEYGRLDGSILPRPYMLPAFKLIVSRSPTELWKVVFEE